MNNPTNFTLINILRRWCRDNHRAETQLDFGIAADDVSSVWDLFFQVEAIGKDIFRSMPLANDQGSSTPDAIMAAFFKDCHLEFNSTRPAPNGSFVLRARSGALLESGETAETGYRVCLIPRHQVMGFRDIVKRKLGL